MHNICFFNTAKAWGGGEKWHLEISTYLHQKGYPVFVFAHVESELFKRLKLNNVPCEGICISNFSFLNPFQHQSLTTKLRSLKVSTIIMNLSRDVKIAGPCAKKAGIKRIIYRRGSAIPIKNSILNRYYFRNVLTDVLANSEATKKTINSNNHNLFKKDKITVIYNGIETTSIKKAKEQPLFTIVNLGRLEYQKNQLFLIELAAELKQRNLHFKLIIGGEGSLRNKLEELIKKLNVANQVSLPGFIEKPLEFINKADVFVLPSFWEGFGYVLAEAALCKKPIVAFNISSNPEIILDNKSGYLTEIGDVNKFADRIEFLYHNKNIREQMGNAGFEHIIQNFDKKTQLQKIEDYIIHE
ncbi:glycosyltransferase [Maribacter ulvicola]|uniref:Glycosyltransferase Family 4 n=1 Tax=Maribacter ulvicola TaxID=228959 RepID=A0A1N6SDL9_9FLAO|nr:glycosyltransferase [Maribacter ulvicola]SIQ39139.1 Glycosyltransferase Family 4 [Maribacter ulvicola]